MSPPVVHINNIPRTSYEYISPCTRAVPTQQQQGTKPQKISRRYSCTEKHRQKGEHGRGHKWHAEILLLLYCCACWQRLRPRVAGGGRRDCSIHIISYDKYRALGRTCCCGCTSPSRAAAFQAQTPRSNKSRRRRVFIGRCGRGLTSGGWATNDTNKVKGLDQRDRGLLCFGAQNRGTVGGGRTRGGGQKKKKCGSHHSEAFCDRASYYFFIF